MAASQQEGQQRVTPSRGAWRTAKEKTDGNVEDFNILTFDTFQPFQLVRPDTVVAL